MSGGELATITLRAITGQPLSEPRIRDMVLSTAHAIAERTGVEIVALTHDEQRITATLRAGRIAALGFAAELRRVTTAWYIAKFGGSTLWGEGPHDEDASEAWKRA